MNQSDTDGLRQKPDATRVDGSRKRRFSEIKAKREWYARHRAFRFARHMGFGETA